MDKKNSIKHLELLVKLCLSFILKTQHVELKMTNFESKILNIKTKWLYTLKHLPYYSQLLH